MNYLWYRHYYNILWRASLAYSFIFRKAVCMPARKSLGFTAVLSDLPDVRRQYVNTLGLTRTHTVRPSLKIQFKSY